MSVIKGIKGATLLELIIAVGMMVTAVVFISLTFPKASASLTNTRVRATASRFADSRIQELKAQSYPYLPVNTSGELGSDPNCDCRAIDMAVIPNTDAIMSDGGITFSRKVCVNLVERTGTTWTSYCPDDPLTPATDKGLKNIRVRVTWRNAGQDYSTEAEALVTR